MVFLFIFLIVTLLIIFSKISIEIRDLKFTSKKIIAKAISKKLDTSNPLNDKFHNYGTLKSSHFNDDYNFQLTWYILSRVPIIRINITKIQIEKIMNKIEKSNIRSKINELEKNINKDVIEKLKHINLELKKTQIKNLELKIDIGTDDTIFTTMLVPIISTIISLFLVKKRVKLTMQTFAVNPIYNNGNLVNISIQGIFHIKLIHIIKVIYIINKKRRVEKNERTSNRRTYGYGYE